MGQLWGRVLWVSVMGQLWVSVMGQLWERAAMGQCYGAGCYGVGLYGAAQWCKAAMGQLWGRALWSGARQRALQVDEDYI